MFDSVTRILSAVLLSVPILTYSTFNSEPVSAASGKLDRAKMDVGRLELKLKDGKIVFWSTNRTLDELRTQISELYAALFNISVLPVRSAKNVKGVVPVKFLEGLNLTWGRRDGYTETLDSVLCDINTDICRRKKVPASPAQISDYTRHVGGYLPSRGIWRSREDSYFLVPDIDFTEIVQPSSYYKKRGQSIESIVTEVRKGCVAYDGHCRESMEFYNRGQPGFDKRDFSGTIQVPTLRVKAIIDLKCERRQCVGGIDRRVFLNSAHWEFDGNIDDNLIAKSAPEASYSTPLILEFHERTKDDLVDGRALAGDLKERLKGLSPHIFSGSERGGGKPNSSHQGSGQSHYREKLNNQRRFIGYYYQEGQIPERLKSNIIPIGVLDGNLDIGHCEIAKKAEASLLIYENEYERNVCPDDAGEDFHSDCQRRSACGHWMASADPDSHHANHVVGTIAAAHDDHGIGGLSPHVKVFGREVIFKDLGRNEKYHSDIAAYLNNIIGSNLIYVFNLSLEYPAPDIPDGDPFITTMMSHKTTLFVTAAGNDRKDLDTACSVWPACADLPNLITVGALQIGRQGKPELLEYKDGQKTRGSNYGKSKVHIAALGQDIISTGAMNTVVSLSGTSQAVPQVTAVAALMMSADRSALPFDVKARILACADPIPNISEKVLTGKLNADCALEDMKNWRIVDRFENIHVGTIVRFLDDNGKPIGRRFVFEDETLDDPDPIFIRMGKLAAIHYIEGSDNYKAYEITGKNVGDRDTRKLISLDEINWTNGDYEIIIKNISGERNKIKLKDIVTIIAPLRKN